MDGLCWQDAPALKSEARWIQSRVHREWEHGWNVKWNGKSLSSRGERRQASPEGSERSSGGIMRVTVLICIWREGSAPCKPMGLGQSRMWAVELSQNPLRGPISVSSPGGRKAIQSTRQRWSLGEGFEGKVPQLAGLGGAPWIPTCLEQEDVKVHTQPVTCGSLCVEQGDWRERGDISLLANGYKQQWVPDAIHSTHINSWPVSCCKADPMQGTQELHQTTHFRAETMGNREQLHAHLQDLQTLLGIRGKQEMWLVEKQYARRFKLCWHVLPMNLRGGLVLEECCLELAHF